MTSGPESPDASHPEHHKSISIELLDEDDGRVLKLHGRPDTHVRAVVAEAFEMMKVPRHERDHLVCKVSGVNVFEHESEELGRFIEHHCQAREWLFRSGRRTRYFVNKEKEFTDQRVLTVAEILEHAELKPVTEYTLKREHPLHDFGSNYTEKVEICEGECFRAVFKGVTPTS